MASRAWPLVLACLAPVAGHALTVRVVDAAGAPVATAMVTVRLETPPVLDGSDGRYPARGVTHAVAAETTRFTGVDGSVTVVDLAAPMRVRVRKPGHKDVSAGPLAPGATTTITLPQEQDAQALADAKPANVWAAAAVIGETPEDQKRFRMQCSFCHQQGSLFMRLNRDETQWRTIIPRMVGYGARLPTRLQESAPARLVSEYARLRANPTALGEPLPWSPQLEGATVDQWPAGDASSQMHDMLVHSNGRVYLGDNIQDRLWEYDPAKGTVVVHVLPHDPTDEPGGIFAARLKAFANSGTYVGLHSLAESTKDGHIFMTPSHARRIIELDPATGAFTVHRMDDGFYPHTIRVDALDRVWFTLALSNQIGMLDRATGRFHYVTLPTRSLREAVTIQFIGILFTLAKYGLKLENIPIDDLSTGLPLPYGIDVTPDGSIWFARLHANDIGRVDPVTLEAQLTPFPFLGPRRLRADADGNLWIGAFPESAVVRFDPRAGTFEKVMMPTQPQGSDTPYSLNVDRPRGIVWVTGTASDTLCAYHIREKRWDVFPLPNRHTFTRDIEFTPKGAAYTSNGAFPAWHVEGGLPTLIRVTPPWAQ